MVEFVGAPPCLALVRNHQVALACGDMPTILRPGKSFIPGIPQPIQTKSCFCSLFDGDSLGKEDLKNAAQQGQGQKARTQHDIILETAPGILLECQRDTCLYPDSNLQVRIIMTRRDLSKLLSE